MVALAIFGVYYTCYRLEAWVRKRYLEAKDQRMSLLRGVLTNIEYVKINGLEGYFCLEMFDRREAELSWVRVLAVLTSLKAGIIQGGCGWAPNIIFNMIWLNYNRLGMDLSKFYLFNSYSSTFQEKLQEMFSAYSYYLKLSVSVRRLELFMNAPEKREENEKELGGVKDHPGSLALSVYNGNFKWIFDEAEKAKTNRKSKKSRKNHKNQAGDEQSVEANTVLLTDANTSSVLSSQLNGKPQPTTEFPENEFMLKNVNLSIRKGEKIAVIGKSSSGTSSLLSALAGEMVPIARAMVLKSGSLGFLPPLRWILGGSIKENILLGKVMDSGLMESCLRAVDLEEDLEEQFEAGLETVLASGGGTVSGGQRSRIALARCLYQK